MFHPVYVDGPLKGKDFPVKNLWQSVQVPVPNGPGRFRQVVYTMRRFGFQSGDTAIIMIIGCSEPGEPDAHTLAELILSDAAKKAIWKQG